MNDGCGEFIVALIAFAFFICGVILCTSLLFGDRLVSEKWMVEQGYAEWVPNTTNGTSRFEWVDLNKGEAE